MMGIFNFAHGEFVLLGAYTVYLFESNGLPVWIGMLAAPIAVASSACCSNDRHPPILCRAIVAMLGTYAIGLCFARDRARAAGRTVLYR